MKSADQIVSGYQQAYAQPEFMSELDKYDNRAWLVAQVRMRLELANSDSAMAGARLQEPANSTAALFEAGYLRLAGG